MPKLTNEDKVAQTLINAVDTLSLDLDKVGQTIAWSGTNVAINRLQYILETAEEEKGEMYVRYSRNTI